MKLVEKKQWDYDVNKSMETNQSKMIVDIIPFRTNTKVMRKKNTQVSKKQVVTQNFEGMIIMTRHEIWNQTSINTNNTSNEQKIERGRSIKEKINK